MAPRRDRGRVSGGRADRGPALGGGWRTEAPGADKPASGPRTTGNRAPPGRAPRREGRTRSAEPRSAKFAKMLGPAPSVPRPFRTLRTLLTTLVVLAAVAVLGLLFRQRFAALESDGSGGGAPGTVGARSAVPVEVGSITRGDLILRRTFSGTLEPGAEFTAASKIAGRLRSLEVELGEAVVRGQVVARIDDAEFVQDVRRVEADLAVARAGRSEAASALEIASRALARARSLGEEGLTSASQLDVALSSELAAAARLEVTAAGVERAEAALESVRLRLGDTLVTANWDGDDEQRVVAARYLDEGGNVAANAPLLSIVRLDPLVCVVDIPERDYARLAVGQRARLVADGYPGAEFEAHVERIAPVFRSSTRQARVELLVANADLRLKPGMFVRVTLELETVPDALSAAADALSERGGELGLFRVDPDTSVAAWIPVLVGVRTGDRVEVRTDDDMLDEGDQIVTLGQELCEDGATVVVRQRRPDASSSDSAAPTPEPTAGSGASAPPAR